MGTTAFRMKIRLPLTMKFIGSTIWLQDIPLHFASENLLQSPKLFLVSSLSKGTCDTKKPQMLSD